LLEENTSDGDEGGNKNSRLSTIFFQERCKDERCSDFTCRGDTVPGRKIDGRDEIRAI